MTTTVSYPGGAILALQITGAASVAVQGNPEADRTIQMPTRQSIAWRSGRWLLEAIGGRILLRETGPQSGSFLQFVLKGDGTKTKLQFTAPDGPFQETYPDLKQIVIGPREDARITLASEQIAEAEQDSWKKTAPVSPSHKVPGTVYQRVQTLESENQALQALLNTHLEKAAAAAEQHRQALSASGQETLTRIQDLKKQEQDQQKQLDAARQEEKTCQNQLMDLQQRTQACETSIRTLEEQQKSVWEELDRLTKIEQALQSTDVQDLQHQVEERRARLGLDEETLRLLEDDLLLKKGTISQGLTQADEVLEKAEERIALFIRLQEKFHTNVNATILGGNGTLSQKEEKGGRLHGN